MSLEQTPIQIYASGIDGDGAFLDLIAVVDDYATLRFTKGIAGAFEITINKNTLYAQEFQRKRIIQLGDDNYKCGVIESVQNEVGPGGAASEIVTIKGRELIGWLDRRYVEPPTGQAYYSLPATTPAETVVKSLIDDSMGPGATNSDRIDSNLVIETDATTGDAYVLSARYDNLLQVVANCCLATNSRVFGYLDHTAKKWKIGFSLGLDRTSGQSTNARAIFSTTRETVESAKLIDTEQSYKNVALVAGPGEGAARATLLVPTSGAATGIERREMFVDARDLTLTASLENRGLQKLSENQYVKFLTGSVLAYSQLRYGTDYDVGDEVTVEQFDQTQDSFITSVEEYWAAGQYKLTVGFDKSSPTISTQTSGALGQIQKTLNADERLAQEGTSGAFSPFDIASGGIVAVPMDYRLIVEPVDEGIQSFQIPIFPIPDPISGDRTYLLRNYPRTAVIEIPESSLMASSGGPFVLTLSTGVSGAKTIQVPIAASGDTILSGPLLFDITVDASGNVKSKAWEVSGSNPNGNYRLGSDGEASQRGTSTQSFATNTVSGAIFSGVSGAVSLPRVFVDTAYKATVTNTSAIICVTTSAGITTGSFTFNTWFSTSVSASSRPYDWIAFGRWRT
jgi:hypothetical protein